MGNQKRTDPEVMGNLRQLVDIELPRSTAGSRTQSNAGLIGGDGRRYPTGGPAPCPWAMASRPMDCR